MGEEPTLSSREERALFYFAVCRAHPFAGPSDACHLFKVDRHPLLSSLCTSLLGATRACIIIFSSPSVVRERLRREQQLCSTRPCRSRCSSGDSRRRLRSPVASSVARAGLGPDASCRRAERARASLLPPPRRAVGSQPASGGTTYPPRADRLAGKARCSLPSSTSHSTFATIQQQHELDPAPRRRRTTALGRPHPRRLRHGSDHPPRGSRRRRRLLLRSEQARQGSAPTWPAGLARPRQHPRRAQVEAVGAFRRVDRPVRCVSTSRFLVLVARS